MYNFLKNILLMAVVCMLTGHLKGETFYVDKDHPGASDSNPGTEGLPWSTIQRGIDVAVAGDIVYVKAGIYSEDLLMKRSGNPVDGHIVFKNFESDKVIIDGSGSGRSTKLIYWKGVSDNGTQKNHLIWDGFEVRNAKKWAFWISGDYNIVRNCKIHDSGHTGIQLITGNHNLFQNNEIYNTGWNGISWEANNGNCGIRTDSNIIEYNYIHDLANHVGVNAFPWEQTPDGKWNFYGGVGNIIRFNVIDNCLEGIYTRYEKDLLIYGNQITNITGVQGIHFHVVRSENEFTYISNTKIYNNIIANVKQHGILNTNAKDVEIKNNIFYGNAIENSKYDIVFSSRTASAGNIFENNIYFGSASSQQQISLYGVKYTIPEFQAAGYEANGMYADPLFVDLRARNFALQPTSPAIDAGLELGVPYNLDMKGITRPQGAGWDIGAFEFVGEDTIPPIPPQNLRIVN